MALLSRINNSFPIEILPILFLTILIAIGLIFLLFSLADLINERKKYYRVLREKEEMKK